MANPVGRPRTTVDDLPQAGFQLHPPHDLLTSLPRAMYADALSGRAHHQPAFALLVRVFFMRDANGVLCYTGP